MGGGLSAGAGDLVGDPVGVGDIPFDDASSGISEVSSPMGGSNASTVDPDMNHID